MTENFLEEIIERIKTSGEIINILKNVCERPAGCNTSSLTYKIEIYESYMKHKVM